MASIKCMDVCTYGKEICCCICSEECDCRCENTPYGSATPDCVIEKKRKLLLKREERI